MRFAEGDRVRHRGLRFISGIVMRVMRIPESDQENDRSYFCRVQLRNGQYYSDRATEWELYLEPSPSSPSGANPAREEKLYAQMG